MGTNTEHRSKNLAGFKVHPILFLLTIYRVMSLPQTPSFQHHYQHSLLIKEDSTNLKAVAVLLRSKYTPEMQSQRHLVEASRYNFRLLRHRKSLEVTESANYNKGIGMGRLLSPPAHAPDPELVSG